MKSQMLVPGRRSRHVLFKSASRAGLWRSGHLLKDPAGMNCDATVDSGRPEKESRVPTPGNGP
jgi:hypothetical protein